MAPSSLSSKSLHHGRSLSLPSTSYSTTSQYDETLTLSTIKVSQTTSSSLSSLNNKINALKNLYHNFEDLLLLPHIQQIILQQPKDKWIDQVLDGHIRLLDACSRAKDLFSQMKQNVQDLLSALRRKDARGVQCYLTSRRKSKKMIQMALKNLRSLRSKSVASLEKDLNSDSMALLCKLKEAESITFVTLESLLSYVIGTKTQSSRSLVSKLMHSKKASHQDEGTDENEFNKVDVVLQKSPEEETQALELVNHLKEMDLNIQVLEEELESLFRQLIKTRVFILNIINY